MKIEYVKASPEDIPRIYELCSQLIHEYERAEGFNFSRVLAWVRSKIETSIDEYTAVIKDGKKAGYYHFYKNADGCYELDDLYIFPEYQNMGIGSQIIKKCSEAVSEPIMLYVFIGNKRAVSLYRRLGFEVIKTVGSSRYIMEKRGGNSL